MRRCALVYPSVLVVFLAALHLSWRRVLWGFLCGVCLWCGRCSRFCVLCVFAGLVLVVAPVMCVVCARLCVCGVSVVRLGACPRLSGLGLATLLGCGSCALWSLGCPGCGAWVWFTATPGWGLLVVVRSPAAPFCVPPPPSFSWPGLACCCPGVLSGTTRAVVGV